MRTAILLLGFLISDSLGWKPVDAVAKFYTWAFVVFATMDIVDFLRGRHD